MLRSQTPLNYYCLTSSGYKDGLTIDVNQKILFFSETSLLKQEYFLKMHACTASRFESSSVLLRQIE